MASIWGEGFKGVLLSEIAHNSRKIGDGPTNMTPTNKQTNK
jgi:hypothetical protein